MRKHYDLSQLDWKLTGWVPFLWHIHSTMELGESPDAEIHAIPAKVPGSVQSALLESGQLHDWNVGLNARYCDWVENKHWIYQTHIPGDWIETGNTYTLKCDGLDYGGWVLINGAVIGRFEGTFIPHCFDITQYLKNEDNLLQIAFDCPPRWLGQCGYTSLMTQWKARFNYTWDWTPRLVQIGVWDSIQLVSSSGAHIEEFSCYTNADPESGQGYLKARIKTSDAHGCKVRLSMYDGEIPVDSLEIDACDAGELEWDGLSVELWYPNLDGEQPLYRLVCNLLAKDGAEIDQVRRTVGFKHIRWEQCEDAPEGADPWICVVNGRPVFLQGINWTPIRPNFADASEEDYRKRLELYRDLGFNLMRVWGGAFLEKECFYDICDELGLLVWQEFPLSSSGLENWPPEDTKSIEELSSIAKSYINRRQHHPSLLMWCGGNELQGDLQGNKWGCGIPVDNTHPLMKRLKEIVETEDPFRRFVATSASGPRFTAEAGNFGQGLHWDVHGPWKISTIRSDWESYWKNDDALFRSEAGAPGCSSVELIRKYIGDFREMPASAENPYWRHPSTWWIEWQVFIDETGREPHDLEEYVDWSQERQAFALKLAVSTCKNRFPKCGGIIIWMGHDSFPCAANTAIVDFEGNPKPAALALTDILRSGHLQGERAVWVRESIT